MKTTTPKNLVAGIAVVVLLLGLATSGRASIVIQETSGPVITGSWSVGFGASGGPFDRITGTLNTPLFEVPGLTTGQSGWSSSGNATVASISGPSAIYSPLLFTATFLGTVPGSTPPLILDFTIFDQGNLVGETVLQWTGTEFDVIPVPEPSTIIAGALLLLPFGATTLRFVRKQRVA